MKQKFHSQMTMRFAKQTATLVGSVGDNAQRVLEWGTETWMTMMMLITSANTMLKVLLSIVSVFFSLTLPLVAAVYTAEWERKKEFFCCCWNFNGTIIQNAKLFMFSLKANLSYFLCCLRCCCCWVKKSSWGYETQTHNIEQCGNKGKLITTAISYTHSNHPPPSFALEKKSEQFYQRIEEVHSCRAKHMNGLDTRRNEM